MATGFNLLPSSWQMEQDSWPITLRCKAKLLRSMTPLICRLLFTSGRNKFIVLSFAYWLFFIISLLTYPKKPFRKKKWIRIPWTSAVPLVDSNQEMSLKKQFIPHSQSIKQIERIRLRWRRRWKWCKWCNDEMMVRLKTKLRLQIIIDLRKLTN